MTRLYLVEVEDVVIRRGDKVLHIVRHGCVPAYNTILSVRGEVLHNFDHGNVLKETDIVLMDGDQQDPRWPGLWFNGMRPPLSGTLGAVGRTGQRIAAAIIASSPADADKGPA